MIARLLALSFIVGLAAPPAPAADAKKDAEAVKAALGELGEFIGQWNVSGTDAKKAVYKEVWTWGWKFPKDAPPAIAIEIKDGKTFTGATVGYDLEKKEFTLAAVGKDGKPQAFTGKMAKGKFVAERTDPATKDVYRLTINTAASGARIVTLYEVVTGGKGLGTTLAKSDGGKEGESLAGGGGKKPECVVTGGAGTIGVSFMGKNYFVCCSGCKDEFNANPKKFVDEYEKNKKK